MNNRLAPALVAGIIGLTTSVSSAFAYDRYAPMTPHYSAMYDDDLTTGSINVAPGGYDRYGCFPNPATEGNANMQSRMVKNYGQTAGGSACY